MPKETHLQRSQPPAEKRQRLARIRGNFYSLLSSVYIHIPEGKSFELKWEPAVELLGCPFQGVEEALRHIERGLNLIKPYSANIPLDEKGVIHLARDWTRLFRGVERNGILPPYESLYRTGKLQEKPAREIHRLFSEMGIQVPEDWHQPPDYIGVELDFMRLLCAKELEACEKGDEQLLKEIVESERSFVEHHLGAWTSEFCEKMAERAREDWFRGVARLTIGLVEYDRQYLSSK